MNATITPITKQTATTRLVIIGGGISGLAAAYEAVQRGETNIDIYESGKRIGGKILNGQVNGVTINRGAEFIGSHHTHLIRLCTALAIPLIENTGMKLEFFQLPNGALMDAGTFYKAYQPYAEQVIRDRTEMITNPTSARSTYVRGLTLEAYQYDLRQRTKQAERSWKQSAKEFFTDSKNESANALLAAANVFAAEVGQLPKDISAAQFIAETSPNTKTLLASTCKWRVAGGTEQLIVKLRHYLTVKGVRFYTQKTLTKIRRAGTSTTLDFADGERAKAAKVIFAVPTYNLVQIKGLETFGLDRDLFAKVGATQYANNIKCTVAIKADIMVPNAAIYGKGFQAWTHMPSQVTFLANADMLSKNQTPKQLLTSIMEAYAQSLGSSFEAMFDVTKLCFTNPGKTPGYATPTVEQLATLDAFKEQLAVLAKQGIGIVGTYLPLHGVYGFMECGVASAKQSVEQLFSQQKIYHLHPHKQLAQFISGAESAELPRKHNAKAS